MARQNSISTVGLKKHIDAGKLEQNGYGYKDFVLMMSGKEQPSFTSVGRIFNKDAQTIKKWWTQYQLEQGAKNNGTQK